MAKGDPAKRVCGGARLLNDGIRCAAVPFAEGGPPPPPGPPQERPRPLTADAYAAWLGRDSAPAARAMRSSIAQTGLLHADLLPHNCVDVAGTASVIDLESIVPAWALPAMTKAYCPPYSLRAAAAAFDAGGGAHAAASRLNACPEAFRRRCCYGTSLVLTPRAAPGAAVQLQSDGALRAVAGGAPTPFDLQLCDGACLVLVPRGSPARVLASDGAAVVAVRSDAVADPALALWGLQSCGSGCKALRHAASGRFLAVGDGDAALALCDAAPEVPEWRSGEAAPRRAQFAVAAHYDEPSGARDTRSLR